MGRKLRHLLIFLLIILKEPNMPEADCSSVVVTSGLDHEYEDVDQHNQTRQGRSRAITESNRKIPPVITRRDSDHQYEDVDRHNQTGQGQCQAITESNTTAVVVTSGLDHEYEDVDKHNQTRQGQSRAITESNIKTEAVVTSGHDHQYENMKQHKQTKPNALNKNADSWDSKSVKTPPEDPNTTEITSGHDQTEQGQSQATTQSLDFKDLSHDALLAALQTNHMYVGVKTTEKEPKPTEITSGHDQTEQEVMV
ncbi:PREDICTED: uncharacterized protein LOC109472236 [Branchiostoma belcheri]|uniref:Uncharacterized protein LOC109472236 n=1 Tax=Branchiostoma belcheri TaxID=7741 RepID=A0A6P4YSX5_BRABE|nr:PREDICTED: uncharacterized protein LOC109472236 [Branchiostoma belcheri]